MSLWQRSLADHSVLGKEIQLQELCPVCLPSRISKLTARTQACGHFQVTYLVLLQPPLASAAQARQLPTRLPPLPRVRGVQQLCKLLAPISCSVAVTEPGVRQSLLSFHTQGKARPAVSG